MEAAVLTQLGLTMSSLQDAVLTIAPAQSSTVENPMGMAPGTKRMIEAAAVHATRLGSPRVGTEHLLMALADQPVPVRQLLIESGSILISCLTVFDRYPAEARVCPWPCQSPRGGDV